MAQRKKYFLVGLFVIMGTALIVAGIIWVGASKYFEKGSKFVTYFDESVQGLQTDSLVKYRGVDIGRVEKIGVAPDQRLVEIVMKLDVGDFSIDGVAAKLSMAGITGIMFVELDRMKAYEIEQSPKLAFKAPYPVIPSHPSDIKQITASINDILNGLKKLDFKSLIDQVSLTVKSVQGFVNSEKLNATMTNLSKTSAHLSSLTGRADELLADGKAKDVITGAKAAVDEARTTFAALRREVESAKIGLAVDKVNQAVDSNSRKMQSALGDIGNAAERLRQTSESLDDLIEQLRVDPSQIIFSSPPPPRQGE